MKINLKAYNLKPTKQTARENIKIDDKQLEDEFAKKMENAYYLNDRALRVGFIIILRKAIKISMPI